MEQHPKSFRRLLPQEGQPAPVSPSAAAASALLSAVYMSPVTVNKIIAAIESGKIPGIRATYL